MSAISRCLAMAVWMACGHCLHAATKHGFIRVVNVLSRGEGPMHVSIDGRRLRAAGYQHGDITGTILLAAGSHEMRFERDGVLAGMARVRVRPGTTTGLVVHGVELADESGPSGRWGIRVLRVALNPAGERRQLHLVSVMPGEPVVLGIGRPGEGWRDVSVRYAAVASMPLKQQRGYFELRHQGQRLGLLAVEEKGNHVVVIHQNGDGLPAAMSYVERSAWILARE